jgi:hypothetical protein
MDQTYFCEVGIERKYKPTFKNKKGQIVKRLLAKNS